MTTPPFVRARRGAPPAGPPAHAHRAVEHGLLPRRGGALRRARPGGAPARVLRALNRWLFRRVEVVVGLDGAMVELLRSQYAGGRDRPRFEVIPNWERVELFPPTPPSSRGRATTTLPSAAAPWCSTSATPASATASAPCWTPPTRLARRGALPLRRRRGPVGRAGAGGGRRARLSNVVLRGYVPKDDTPAVMAGADLALITLDDRSLGVMSPSKLHANLAAGLPVLYVGPEGSNVDEAIARSRRGAASAMVTSTAWWRPCASSAATPARGTGLERRSRPPTATRRAARLRPGTQSPEARSRRGGLVEQTASPVVNTVAER